MKGKRWAMIILISFVFILILVVLLVITFSKPKTQTFVSYPSYREGDVVHHCEPLDWAWMDFGDGLTHVNDCKKP